MQLARVLGLVFDGIDAHRDPAAMGQNLKKALQEALKHVSVLSTEALVEARFERLMAYGRVKEQAVG